MTHVAPTLAPPKAPHGQLPPALDENIHAQRCLAQLRSKDKNIEKYIYLSQLKDADHNMFYRLCLANMAVSTATTSGSERAACARPWSMSIAGNRLLAFAVLGAPS